MTEQTDIYLLSMLEKVKHFGVGIQYVLPGETTPPFGYTVGLTIKGHREIVTFGMDPQNTAGILNDVAKRVLDGETLEAHQVFDDLAVGFRAALIVVEQEEADEYLGVANALYAVGDKRVEAYQLVFEGPDGLWPWDDKSVYTDTGYPLLGHPPAETL